MQKIKYGVLDKLLRADLSRAEMDFILHISHYQDDTGCVSGIYYRDICEALQISYQTFYDVLRSLQAKEIIKVDKAFYGDWDVTILDNSFQNGITGYVREKAQKYAAGYCSSWGTYSVFYQFFSLFL